MRTGERGLSILFVAVVLLVAAAATLAFLALTRTTADVGRASATTATFAKAQAALEQFASTATRLPCPANPAIDTGDAEPNAATTNCTYPAGTIPWRTIGLRREDSLDAWGWKISYRVYAGAAGLTQLGGASMVDCDTVEPTPAGTTANGLCKPTHDTTEAQFLAGKGFTVSDFGAVPPATDVAYVLISHGPTGLGAYTTSGGQKQPSPASADELANLGSAGPFVARAAITNVAPEAAAHFDDTLVYRRLPDFVKRANLAARDWPEAAPPSLANLTFNTATVSAALGSSASYGDTGQASIGFPNATVSASDSGGTENLSFTSSGGYEGIGGVNGTPFISSASAETMRVDLSAKAQQLAVTFFDFGRQGGPGNPREQVTFTFYNGGTQVATPTTGQGCHTDGGLATFSLDIGLDFDRVDIKAIPPTSGAAPTQFLFVQLLSCAPATTCKTSLSVPSNLC